MKKKTTLTLDLDDSMPDFDDYAFLLFGSTTPSYVFVDDLNRLYGLQLNRAADMELQQSLWPMFTYRDTLTRLNYYLIERPAASTSAAWPTGHKMLVLRGEVAEETADAIHNEFSTARPPADPTDLLAAEHYAQFESFLAAFTITRRIDPTAEATADISRKAQKEQADLTSLLTDIVDYIDMNRI